MMFWLRRSAALPRLRVAVRRGTGSKSGSAPSFVGWYNRMLEQRPILTKSLTTATLVGIGDIFSQKVVEKRERLDGVRIGRMMGLGALMIGPTLHAWYGYLYTAFPGTAARAVATRLVLDQARPHCTPPPPAGGLTCATPDGLRPVLHGLLLCSDYDARGAERAGS